MENKRTHPYVDIDSLDIHTRKNLLESKYFICTSASQIEFIRQGLIEQSGSAINYCLKNPFLIDRHQVLKLLFSVLTSTNFYYSFTYMFTYMYNPVFINTYDTDILQPESFDVAYDIKQYFGQKIFFYSNRAYHFTNFLLVNNLIKDEQDVISGSRDEIVSRLKHLTEIRPLFDPTQQSKHWSSRSQDHRPTVIKWLAPDEQNKETIEFLTNKYLLEQG